MAISITHPFVSAIADDAGAVAAGEVVPSNWNAAHAIAGGTTGSVLFIGASSALSQDNAKFFWDDTGFVLKIAGELDFQSATSTVKVGGALELDFGVTLANAWTSANSFNLSSTTNSYFIQGIPSLFVAPNVSGNNWFESGAGNRTLSGHLNFATGDGALAAVTTGFNNVAIGAKAMGGSLDASQNIAIGTQAMWLTQSDSNNIAIGFNALVTLGNGGAGGGGNQGNLAIGFGTLGNASIATNNVAIGFASMSNIGGTTTADHNVVIGSQAGNNLGAGGGASVDLNTFIGPNCGSNITGASRTNTWIGGFLGPSSAVNETILISTGSSVGAGSILDYGVTTNAITSVPHYSAWSFSYDPHFATGAALHLYNFQDHPATAMTVYERAILDWSLTTNVFRIGTQAAGGGTVRIIAIDGFQKAGAPAAGDLPSGTCALINDTSGGNTWLVYNNAGAIRKVQLV